MKFTKKQFKRVSALVGAISLCVAFGIGNLIVNNEKIDNVPVVTVPMYAISPSDIAFEQNDFNTIHIDYNFYKSIALGNFSLYANNDLDFYNNQNNHLVCIWTYTRNAYDSDDILTNTYTFDLGVIQEWDNDFYLEMYFSCPIPQVNRPHALSMYLYLSVEEYTYNYAFNDYYAYSSDIGSSEGNIYFAEDYLSSELFNFAYFDVLESNSVGLQYILSHLDEFGLYTESQYYAYGDAQYQLGRETVGDVLSLGQFVREIFRAPISMFKNAFNFTLPLPDGSTLNVGGILTFFLTIGIALTIVNLIFKIGGH